MMNTLKPGSTVYGIKPEMLFCDTVTQSIFNAHGYSCIRTDVVRRAGDDYFAEKSLHCGFAIDYKTKHIRGSDRDSKINRLVSDLRIALPCCDIVFEHTGKALEHLHVEFDPKDDPLFQAHKACFKATGAWPK
jgi:hypothetical protein